MDDGVVYVLLRDGPLGPEVVGIYPTLEMAMSAAEKDGLKKWVRWDAQRIRAVGKGDSWWVEEHVMD